MKNSLQYLMMLCTLLLTSCNLFIDEDLERQLIEYDGKGYDAVTTIQNEQGTVSYQYKSTTMELNADHPLTRYIEQVEYVDSAHLHIVYFSPTTPHDLLPREGQHVVSNNTDIFETGMCALVALVRERNGRYEAWCKAADVKEAFEHLNFHLTLPANDYLDVYDVYDEDGNFLYHVDNTDQSRITRAEEGDDFINMDIPIPSVESDRLTEWKKKHHLDRLQLTITGGVKAKLYINCDFDFDNGLTFSARMKDGSFDIGVKIDIIVGGMTSSKKAKVKGKFLGNDDLLKGRLRLTVGPVVVVPVFGFSVNYQFSGNVTVEYSYNKPFDFEVGFRDGDFYSKDYNNKPDKQTFKVDASGSFDFPILKISIGFGLFTSDLSIRAELYIKLNTKTTLATGVKNFGEAVGDEPVHIDFNPKITSQVGISFAVALVAKGMIIKKVLEKIKEHVIDKAAKLKDARKAMEAMDAAVKAYERTGTITDWLNLKKGETSSISPAVMAEMNKLIPAGASESERAGLIDFWLEQKAKEKSAIPDPSNLTEEDLQMRPLTDADNDKEFALRLGPIDLDKPKWVLIDRYLFPKMKEGSFKVGQKWTDANQDIIFSGEWVVEDPGLVTYAKTLYPCFTIMSGSEEIFTLFPENEKDAELNGDTPKGKRYSVEIPHLHADYPYTCIPGYALSYDGDPVVQDKGMSFSTVTPTISIVKLVENDSESTQYLNGNISLYNFYFDTHTDVRGLVNIQEWGILDNNDGNPFTNKHKSKSSTLQGSHYVHHWSVKNCTKSKITVNLSPYIFGRDATSLSDIKQAKMFPAFKKTIRYKFDFSDDSRKKAGTSDEEPDDGQGYTLTLDSVTCDGVRVEWM